jgi:hypothetical protein
MTFLNKKNIWSKINFLAYSENFKSAKTYFLPNFLPLWTNLMRNFGKILIENSYFTLESSKNYHYGPIFQLAKFALQIILEIVFFFSCGGGP